jgi:D-sedoheptulose 7-phosphate isomerase
MSMIRDNFSEHLEVIQKVSEACAEDIAVVGQLMVDVLAQGGTIYWCGNGGSAADSQHLAAELVGRFKGDRQALRSAALSTDSSVLTCVANDYSYDSIFSRQIEALGRAGDLLVGISTSGNSGNVLKAFEAAKQLGLHTVGLLGKDGGKAKRIADHSIVIPSDATARIQESHILIGHTFCDLIEEGLGIAKG